MKNTELFKTLTLHQRFFVSIIKNTTGADGWSDVRQKDIISRFNLNRRTTQMTIKKLKSVGMIEVDHYISGSNIRAKYRILDNENANLSKAKCPLTFCTQFMEGDEYEASEKAFILSMFDFIEETSNEDAPYVLNMSRAKLSKKTGISITAVNRYVEILESKGTIKKLDKGFGYWVCI